MECNLTFLSLGMKLYAPVFAQVKKACLLPCYRSIFLAESYGPPRMHQPFTLYFGMEFNKPSSLRLFHLFVLLRNNIYCSANPLRTLLTVIAFIVQAKSSWRSASWSERMICCLFGIGMLTSLVLFWEAPHSF